MSHTFYAIVDDKNNLISLDFNDSISPKAVFPTESEAYACVIIEGKDIYRVVPVQIISAKDKSND